MCFEFYDYIFPGVIVPVILLFLFFIPVIFLSKLLAKKKSSTAAIFIPFIIGLAIFYGFLATAAKGLQPPLTLLLQSNAPVQVTSGTITEIRRGAPLPVYFDSDTKTFHPAVWLIVNDEAYYLPYCQFEKGTQVKIAWATEAHIVYKLEDTSNNRDTSLQTVADTPQRHQNTRYQKSGILFARICLFTIVGVVFLQYLLGRRIANLLQQRDQYYTNGIIPNRIGLLHFSITFLPFIGILVGLQLAGYRSAMMIAVIATLTLAGILLIKQTTTMVFLEGKLIYQNFLHTRSYDLSEIAGIKWRQSRIPGNRCLVIVLRNGRLLCFEQENFWGLQDAFIQIKKHLGSANANG